MDKEVIYFAAAIILLYVIISLYNRNRENLDEDSQIMTVNANNNLEFQPARPIYTAIDAAYTAALASGGSGITNAELDTKLVNFVGGRVTNKIDAAKQNFMTADEFAQFQNSPTGLGSYMKIGPNQRYNSTITQDENGQAIFAFGQP